MIPPNIISQSPSITYSRAFQPIEEQLISNNGTHFDSENDTFTRRSVNPQDRISNGFQTLKSSIPAISYGGVLIGLTSLIEQKVLKGLPIYLGLTGLGCFVYGTIKSPKHKPGS